MRSCRPVLVRPDPNSAPFPILSERINGRKKSHVDIHDETTSSLLRVHRGEIRAVEGPRIKFFNNAIHRLERNQSVHRGARRDGLPSRYRGFRRLFYSLPATQSEANLGKSVHPFQLSTKFRKRISWLNGRPRSYVVFDVSR